MGNSNFLSDDIWDFKGFIPDVGGSPAYYQIRMTNIKHPEIKHTVKKYLVFDLTEGKFNTTKRNYEGFCNFIDYLDEFFPAISSLTQVNHIIISGYFQHLLTRKSKKTGKALSRTGLFKGAQMLKDILLEGSKRGWEVPENVTWVRTLYQEMIQDTPRTDNNRDTPPKGIPKDEATIKKILDSARNETDIYTKADVIIQSQCGMRIGAVLSLKAGCMSKDKNGNWMIDTIARKTEKNQIKRKKPAHQIVKDVIDELERATAKLRKESGLPYLFIYREAVKGVKTKEELEIRVFDKRNWNRDKIKPFVSRWDIQENGELIEITSHTFRHIFVTYALKGGMRLESVMDILDHRSRIMTGTYAHLTAKDVKEKMGQIFAPISILGTLYSRL
ncbi:MAG: site-specific integrase [Thermincola sp.]|nr:site-specific integrase [Thermincola sp.]MDT3701975.1 site-specific integrase [Thermincola sp.]